MTAGKIFLWLAWCASIGAHLSAMYADPYLTGKLCLFVLALGILGLIHRLDELERRIAGRVPGPEPKPKAELVAEPTANEDGLPVLPSDW